METTTKQEISHLLGKINQTLLNQAGDYYTLEQLLRVEECPYCGETRHDGLESCPFMYLERIIELIEEL